MNGEVLIDNRSKQGMLRILVSDWIDYRRLHIHGFSLYRIRSFRYRYDILTVKSKKHVTVPKAFIFHAAICYPTVHELLH